MIANDFGRMKIESVVADLRLFQNFNGDTEENLNLCPEHRSTGPDSRRELPE